MKTVTERPSFQGDMMLQKIDGLPSNTVQEVEAENGVYIVAHSETGHHHVIEARHNVKMYRLPEEIYEVFVVVDGHPATVEHKRPFDAHAPLSLPPGTYRLRRQREYTPEGYRRIAD